MRHLAMRFRGLLHGGAVERLDIWLNDARMCSIYGMRRFAMTLWVLGCQIKALLANDFSLATAQY
jgi:hypothetical protein